MQKLLQLELNEINFDFVRAYGEQGRLPRLNGLIAEHGLIETTSEREYEQLEPWIQWVSAHTGLDYAEHQIFRLGDISDRGDLAQIWELLEAQGHSVGAVSPMNASNLCKAPAFFVPDPWTSTTVTGDWLTRRMYDAIAQIVNDNAQARVEKSSLAWLALGLARFSRATNYPLYLSLAARARKASWSRAMLLDLLLSDLFIANVRRTDVAYATLFLNAGAHIQHHYMFNADVYRGTHRNPDWYVDAEADPIFDVYQLYDTIVGQIVDAFPSRRVMIATGLHQDPYQALLFYWRLRDHDSFLKEAEIPHVRVEPRMSRDFVVYCADAAQAEEAERLLNSARASDGQALFEVDNRGDSLFVMLVYPSDIGAGLGYSLGNRHFTGLAEKTAFVAIKNGEHNGVGYLIDTAADRGGETSSVPVTSLFGRTLAHFGVDADDARNALAA